MGSREWFKNRPAINQESISKKEEKLRRKVVGFK